MNGNLYWKNLKRLTIKCNDNTAKAAGLASAKDLIGLSVIDIFSKKEARIIDKIDKQIIESKKIHCAIESLQGFYLSIKSPLFNDRNEVTGLFGISFALDNSEFLNIVNLSNNEPQIIDFSIVSNFILKYLFTSNRIRHASLSLQQEKVLNYLCRGLTAKEIGKIMKVSDRTIETHIEILKKKLDCRTKYELIEFMKYIPT